MFVARDSLSRVSHDSGNEWCRWGSGVGRTHVRGLDHDEKYWYQHPSAANSRRKHSEMRETWRL